MKEKIWEKYEDLRMQIIRITTISARKRNLILEKLSQLIAMIIITEDKKWIEDYIKYPYNYNFVSI